METSQQHNSSLSFSPNTLLRLEFNLLAVIPGKYIHPVSHEYSAQALPTVVGQQSIPFHFKHL
jgi:hypothetical protein